jgi:hypothetical protein
MSTTLEKDIIAKIAKLRDDQLQEVLHFARSLGSNLKGTRGADLLPFAGTIERDDFIIMAKAKRGHEERVG